MIEARIIGFEYKDGEWNNWDCSVHLSMENEMLVEDCKNSPLRKGETLTKQHNNFWVSSNGTQVLFDGRTDEKIKEASVEHDEKMLKM